MGKKIKIYIGADHRGFELKNHLIEKLQLHNYEVIDLGAYEFNPNDDYTDIALKVALKVAKEKNSRGILLCGSGIGVCITANKVKGIRAGCSENLEIIKKAREDDDINILCLPADFLSQEEAFALVDIFLNTEFKSEEKYLRRIKKIKKYESFYFFIPLILFLALLITLLLFCSIF